MNKYLCISLDIFLDDGSYDDDHKQQTINICKCCRTAGTPVMHVQSALALVHHLQFAYLVCNIGPSRKTLHGKAQGISMANHLSNLQ